MKRQETAEHYQNATEAKRNENNAELDCWEKITSFDSRSTGELYSAVKALEKATEAIAKGNQPLAELWNKIAMQYQETAEYHRKAIESKLSKNDEETDRWREIIDSFGNNGYKLTLAAEPLEKAAEATAKGNQSLAELWNKIAAQYQEAVEHYRTATEAKLSGNELLAELWTKTATQYERSVEYGRKTAEAMLNENYVEVDRWGKVNFFGRSR